MNTSYLKVEDYGCRLASIPLKDIVIMLQRIKSLIYAQKAAPRNPNLRMQER